MILEQIIDAAGKMRIKWQQPSGVVYHFKFNTEPTQKQIESVANEREALEEYSDLLPIFDNHNEQLIRMLIDLFKSNPTINSTQFNSYVEAFTWNEEAQIRTLMYEIGSKLYERGEITLNSLTESQFLQKTRDFIVNAPTRKLAKLFLNQIDL